MIEDFESQESFEDAYYCEECGEELPGEWEFEFCKSCFIPKCDECGKEIFDTSITPDEIVFCRDCGNSFGKIEQWEIESDQNYYPEGMDYL